MREGTVPQPGFSVASYYLWRSKFGGLDVPETKQHKSVESHTHKKRKTK